ncbi:MAG TPA: peptidoglycan bridge formation glycyltransferase FemA/FemB family protein, partial [Terriglobia bacterium]|nr:peptidoglycan bridge formation glycyltransferase FemA/FemB family protein [Terriglobia bacterium]
GGAADAEAAGRMARALRQEYAERRGLFLRILPNAFAGTERARLFQAAFTDGYREEPNQAAAYRTLVLDLASPLEELRRRLDKKWRNQLSQAERKPLRVIAGSSAEEFRRFLPIYAQMRDRKGFDTTVDADEFRRMQEILPAPQRMRVLLCEEQGEAVAGVVASAMGNTAIYLLGATSDRGLSSRGSYLLQWSLIGWLKEQGIRWYDLGGIDPEANPGVYLFKKGLSGRDCAHIASYAACESAVSSSLVQAGEAGRRMLRAWKQRWCAHGEDGGRRR